MIRLGKPSRELIPPPLPHIRVNRPRVFGELAVTWLIYGTLSLVLRQKLCSRCGSPRVRSFCGHCGWQQDFAPGTPPA
jgi:hypothetical protein